MTEARNSGRRSDGRFAPGNPGKPKGSRHTATRMTERLMEADAADIVATVIRAAKGGDMVAAKIVIDRLSPIRRGRPVRFNLPPMTGPEGILAAFDSVTAAMAAGEMTPEEAASVAAVLAAHRAAIDTVELARRMDALEAAIGKDPK